MFYNIYYRSFLTIVLVKDSSLTGGKNMTKWLVVSGLDGSGKTSLVSNLQKWLEEERNKRVKTSRLPHDRHLVKDLLNVSKDSYTDRMLFALDNRIFAEHFKDWVDSGEYDFIVTQRGFLDSFVHGAVQGYDYSWIANLNRIEDLPKCEVIIHMVAEAETAYNRIKDDEDADKFEYISYIRRQESETRRAYYELQRKNVDLEHFSDAYNIYVDTTQMTIEEKFEFVKRRLIESGILDN